ncbi:HNH endonuclease [Staphylococcus pettenkoferi]|uniref:HNH endonuclease n=1 Tax=Staphylococcus pettenkoferi TaxID=170573 RepID=UPI0021B6437A|nr:HNH endonuclease [Staphylococcus pettenkoferi]
MTQTWLIPCNTEYYDIHRAFTELTRLDWSQTQQMKSIEVGDIIYIYLSAPVKAIRYKCRVTEVNKPKITIDDNKYIKNGATLNNKDSFIEIEYVKEFNTNKLNYNVLKQHGLKGIIQGPRRLYGELKEYISETVDDYREADIKKVDNSLENTIYEEGRPVVRYGVRYERNPSLRAKAIEIHGTKCKVCGFDFEKFYGDLGKGYIEIHHLKPMYENKEKVEVNPKTDMVPLCANCYRMIHRRKNAPLSVEALKDIIKQNE